MTRTAISPRFATSTRENITDSEPDRPPVQRLELEEQLAVLDRLRVADVDPPHDRLDLGLHLVHQLHRLQDAQRLARRDGIALLDERRRAGLRRAVEGADHRALHAHQAVLSRTPDRFRLRLGRGGRNKAWLHLRRPPHAHTRAVLLDRDLADAGLLHDAHDVADLLLTRAVDALRGSRLLAGRALAHGTQEALGLAREQSEQKQLLLARREALRALPQRVHIGRRLVGAAAEQLDRTRHRGVDRPGGVAEAPADEVTELVDERP